MPPLTTLEKPTPQNLPTPPAKHCPAVKPCPTRASPIHSSPCNQSAVAVLPPRRRCSSRAPLPAPSIPHRNTTGWLRKEKKKELQQRDK
ncbi:hypothetical protein M0R45_037456 [Rubus argutus]|uniref:Uncharacterized protein n=1 Tax=Rubus argutus TaxID=59490 RepID=A0AAW1W2B0_RUBAR